MRNGQRLERVTQAPAHLHRPWGWQNWTNLCLVESIPQGSPSKCQALSCTSEAHAWHKQRHAQASSETQSTRNLEHVVGFPKQPTCNTLIKVRMVLLENVPNICADTGKEDTHHNPLYDLEHHMSEVGYHIPVCSLFNAHDHGSPQHRQRFYGALACDLVPCFGALRCGLCYVFCRFGISASWSFGVEHVEHVEVHSVEMQPYYTISRG